MSKKTSHRSATWPSGKAVGASVGDAVGFGVGLGVGLGVRVGFGVGEGVSITAWLGASDGSGSALPGNAATAIAPTTIPMSARRATATPDGVEREVRPRVARRPGPALGRAVAGRSAWCAGPGAGSPETTGVATIVVGLVSSLAWIADSSAAAIALPLAYRSSGSGARAR